jgi:hypothetical protein
MRFPRRTRLVLRVVGVACLVAGLFPYYSHTSNPPADSSGSGTPSGHSSRTVLRVGLPFSPLYEYEREEHLSVQTTTTTAPQGLVTGKSGEARTVGETSTTQFSSGLAFHSRTAFFSGSTVVAVVGLIALGLSFLGRRRGPPAQALPEAAGEAGLHAEPGGAEDRPRAS